MLADDKYILSLLFKKKRKKKDCLRIFSYRIDSHENVQAYFLDKKFISHDSLQIMRIFQPKNTDILLISAPKNMFGNSLEVPY